MMGAYHIGARNAGYQSRLGFIEPASAMALATAVSSLFGKLFGGDPRIKADNETMAGFLKILQQINQLLQDDRAASRAGQAGYTPEDLEAAALALEDGAAQTLASFQHPSHFQNNEAFVIAQRTVDGLRKWAARKRGEGKPIPGYPGGGGEILPGVSTSGIIPWVIGAGVLYLVMS